MNTVWTIIPKASAMGWTTIAKPQSSIVTVSGTGGMPIGLLLALTYSTNSSVVSSIWTPVAKAVGTSWTTIAKGT